MADFETFVWLAEYWSWGLWWSDPRGKAICEIGKVGFGNSYIMVSQVVFNLEVDDSGRGFH